MNFSKVIKKKTLFFSLLAVSILILIILIIFFKNNNDTGETTNLGEDINVSNRDNFDQAEAEALMAMEEINELVLESKIISPGSDLISKDGRIINSLGVEVRTDVESNSIEAPKQSLATSVEELPAEVIKLSVGPDGFIPNEFKVKADQVVSLSLTGTDNSPHVFTFKDSSLRAVYININEGETKLVNFKAPKEKGSYDFYCDFPGHRSRGEEGVMIVQ